MVIRPTHTSDEPGFGLHHVDSPGYKAISLYVPQLTLAQIHEEQLAREKAEEEEERARQEKEDLRDSFLTRKGRSTSSSGRNELDPEAEAMELQEAADETYLKMPDQVGVYDPSEPIKLIRGLRSRTPDKDVHRRNEDLYQRLKTRGHLRTMARARIHPEDFIYLREAFPHFGKVIDLVQEHNEFVSLTDRKMSLPPILLAGAPGIGKTRFAQELAKMLGTVTRRLSFDNNQNGSSLLGSDRHWANTSYGLVFESVVLGDHANPLILLDEIDKAGRNGSTKKEGYPLASLHSLLEPITSSRVRDISVDFEFDASRVIWIATANDPSVIPSSLRSRFEEFWIEQPTAAQALQMAYSVAGEVHHDLCLEDFEPPTRQVLSLIAYLSAREQARVLRRAYASAVAAGKSRVDVCDLPEDVRQEAQELLNERPRKATNRLH